MATQSQIDANRRNAQKSTGPKTAEGRAAVRHNALKHGLTAEVLLPGMEDRPEFDRLCEAFETEYQPVGPTEESLLENLVAAKWRLSRARKEETGFFTRRSLELEHNSQEYRGLAPNAKLALIVDLDSAGPNTLPKISRYEARLERSFNKALTELRRTQVEHALACSNKVIPPSPQPSANEEVPEPEPEPPSAKQTQSEEPVANNPQPEQSEIPRPASENQHPTTNILHPS